MPKLQLPRDPAVTYRGAAPDHSSDRELALIALLQLPQRRAIHAKWYAFSLAEEKIARPDAEYSEFLTKKFRGIQKYNFEFKKPTQARGGARVRASYNCVTRLMTALPLVARGVRNDSKTQKA
jgi:hypothetical protein